MSTQKVMNPVGNLTIKDVTNGYDLTVTFDAQKEQRSSGLMSFFSGSPEVTETGGEQFRRDLLTVEIHKVQEEGGERELVSKAEGSYLEQIKFEEDDEPFWTINSEIERIQMVDVDPSLILESDTTKRPDANHIIAEEWDEAEASKHTMEELQRADKRLRTRAEEARNQQ